LALVRPVSSIGTIPSGGITTAYPAFFAPELQDAVVPVGHVAASALVLE
jgi:hypothetical protein